MNAMCLRALDTNQPLDRFLEIKALIDALTEELELLKPEITAALWEEPEYKTRYRGCEITLGSRKTYRYSEAVLAMQRDLKALKDYERATGEAVVVRDVSFPVVTPLPVETTA